MTLQTEPKFTKDLTIENVKEIDSKLSLIHKKLTGVFKIVTSTYENPKTKEFFNPQICQNLLTKVDSINSRFESINHKDYVKDIAEIVTEFEKNTLNNNKFFYNKKLVAHYKKVYNHLLVAGGLQAVVLKIISLKDDNK